MEKNLFLDLTRTLTDKAERKRLLDFVRSPYFNLSEKLDYQITMLELAWAWWDAGHEQYWNEVEIFHKIFGRREPFSQNRINQFKSRLVGLLRAFFSEDTRRQHQHPAEKLRWEMQYYRRKHLTHLHELREKEARKELARRNKRLSTDELLQEYLLEYEIAWLSPGENHKKPENYLVGALDNLDVMWLAARTRWTAMLLDRNQRTLLREHKHYEWFLQKLLARFAHYPPTQNVLVRLFQKVTDLFASTTDPEQTLHDFLAFVRKHDAGVDPMHLDELEAMAGNFCVRQINQGRTEFYQHYFDIQKTRLETRRIYRENKILAASYLSIVKAALRLSRESVALEWVKTFLDAHRNRLHNRDAAEEVVLCAYAHYYFHLGKYELVQEIAQKSYRDVNFKIDSKVLEIKALYELGNPAIESRTQATYTLFRRELKMPPLKKKPLLRFVNCTEKLYAESTLPRASKLKSLEKEVNSQLTAETDWLLAKIHQLLERAK